MTYWNNEGKYQAWYDELWKQVPPQGKAEKSHIDLVRCISKLYHDHYNNGSGNWDVLKNYVWHNIKYWEDEILDSPEANGAGMVHSLLRTLESRLDGLMKFWDSPYHEERFSDISRLLEKLMDIIVRYAWEKEHG